MKNIYTVLFSINDFEKQSPDLVDVDTVFDAENIDFQEVYKELDKVEYEAPKSAVDKVLNFLHNCA